MRTQIIAPFVNLHVTLGRVSSVHQRLVSGPLHWQATLSDESSLI